MKVEFDLKSEESKKKAWGEVKLMKFSVLNHMRQETSR